MQVEYRACFNRILINSSFVIGLLTSYIFETTYDKQVCKPTHGLTFYQIADYDAPQGVTGAPYPGFYNLTGDSTRDKPGEIEGWTGQVAGYSRFVGKSCRADGTPYKLWKYKPKVTHSLENRH